MNERESLQDLAADYALGLLGPEESAAFELELAQSPGLQLIVRECREALAVLPGGIQSPAPAADLRARVIDRVLGTATGTESHDAPVELDAAPGPGTGLATDDDFVVPITSESPVARAPRRGGSSAGWWMALAASLVAATGLGVLWRSALRAGQAALVREAALRASVDSVSKQLAARDATLRAILAPGVELHLLRSTGAPEPGIEFFWNKKSHSALMYAFNLPPSAKGRTYQLWMIQGDKRIPSVTFDAASDGHALVDKIAMPTDILFEALAVTEEPAGGSAQPTTPVLLVASIGS